MVKRSLLAAQRGNGAGTFIRGLRAMHLSTNTSTPIEQTVVPVAAALPTIKRKAPVEPKKPRKKTKNNEEQQVTSATKTATVITRSKNALIENIYGAEEAAKKRRMMESKTLDKVTTMREAFEVCLFKAEKTESDADKNNAQLQQAIEQLNQLKRSKAKIQDIARCEEQVRQLRVKVTKSRSKHQTPIDVIVNVAKFSLANAEKKEEEKKEPAKEEQPKGYSHDHDQSGSICTISLAGVRQHLQAYIDKLPSEYNKPLRLPPLQYNWKNEFAARLAKQFVENDSVANVHWHLQEYEPLHQKEDEDENDEDEDDEEDEEDDDVFDDAREKEWLSKNEIDIVERILQNVHVLNHPKTHSWDQVLQFKQQMQEERAKIVAQRLMSLFFKEDSNLAAANESLETLATQNEPVVPNSKREISLVRIGQLEKSAAIGGKTRNRVRNKMKPARNTVNVSIMNFLRIEMHERSDKHVAAARFIGYLQEFEKQNGEKGNNHSMFSSFINQSDEKLQQQQTLLRTTLKKRKHDALIGDCNNAAESIALPNYAAPKCVACGSPVHISKRTGMETCTSPSCAATSYRPTGFDIVHLEQQVHNTYQYLLTVHMKSTLRRVQGKESAMVPKRVRDAVKDRLDMERFDIKHLTPKKVKDVLKKLDLSAWYNHRHKICAAITGRKPYQFSAEEEDVILAVFERLIEPYNLYRPKTDENFPYYRYALHKILQLLGYPDEVLRDFPILKSRKNHQRKEAIWKKMMDYRGWPPYRS